MAELSTDYDASIVEILHRALRKSFSFPWIEHEDSKPFEALMDQGNAACVEDYYCQAFRGKAFTRLHRYILTLLLLIEPRKVLQSRFEHWFGEATPAKDTAVKIICLRPSEQNVEPLPELLRDFLQPCERLTYPEKIVLTHHTGIPWENFLSCLQQPAAKCDFDLFYASGLLNVLCDRAEVKDLVCHMCIELLLENKGEMPHVGLFMEVVHTLCSTGPVSASAVALILHLTHRIERYFSTDSIGFDAYSFLNGVVLVVDTIQLLMVNRATAISQALHQSSISEAQKVPPVYTMQYHVAHAGLLVCERIWDQQLASVRPLISLTRLLLCLSDTFDILSDVSTMERELMCISSTVELILERNILKVSLDAGERKELESIRARVGHSVRSIHRSDQ